MTIVGAVATVAVTALWTPRTSAAVATGLCLLVLVMAALVDAVEHRLPNVLVAAAAVPVSGLVVVSVASGSLASAGAGALGAALVGGPLLATHVASPSGMGFGDVKAGAVLGAAAGLINPQIAVLALFLGLSGSAGWAVIRRQRSIPLGPGLVAGGLVALVVAERLHVAANP